MLRPYTTNTIRTKHHPKKVITMPLVSEMTEDQLEHLELSVCCVNLLQKGIPQKYTSGRSVSRIYSAWTEIITYERITLEARSVREDYVDVNWLDWRPRVFLRDLAREGPGFGTWEGIEWALVKDG